MVANVNRSWRLRFLTVVLTVLALLPFSVFVVRPDRQPRFPAAERRDIRDFRARRHPTAGSVVEGMLAPLVWIGVFAWVGRRGFGLRV